MTFEHQPAPAYGKPLEVAGIPVHPVGVDAVHGYLGRVIDAGQNALVLNVNVHACNLALHTPWLKDFLRGAQMVFCDGDGVRWGLKLLGLEPPPKITYDRWMWQLAEFTTSKGYTMYFMGSRPGVAEKAAARLRQKYPALRIVGARDGFFQKEGPENEAVIAEINRLAPNILILGFGMPMQEKWLLANWHRVRANIFLTGGACFEYVAGRARRAPAWMIRANLEWLFRLLQEPKRLFKRYIWGNPYFMFRVLCEKLSRGLKR